MNTILITKDGDGNVSVVPNASAALRKSASGRRLVATTCVDLCQLGRDEMTPEEKFFNGGTFQALVPRPVTLLTDEPVLREIREAFMRKSLDATAELDAGRGRLSDILAIFPNAVLKGGAMDEEYGEYDEDGNAIDDEPLQKGVDRGLFNGQMLRKGAGADIVRTAYREHAADPGTSPGDLRKAAAELDAIVDRLEGGR